MGKSVLQRSPGLRSLGVAFRGNELHMDSSKDWCTTQDSFI